MIRKILILLLIWTIVVAAYHVIKPLPSGTSVEYPARTVAMSDVRLLTDETWVDASGARQFDQHIFDEALRMIADAQQFILTDMFLFNDFQGASPETHRALSSEFANALIAKKQAVPDIHIIVVTDPINTVYGGMENPLFMRMEEAGIQIVMTDLAKLRDTNPTFSGFWRVFVQWFGNDPRPGYLPNPFDADSQKISVRSYLALLNFKANHRKLLVADRTPGMQTLIASANPHDGSSAHSNVALLAGGDVWQDAIRSEQAVAHMSGTEIKLPQYISDILSAAAELPPASQDPEGEGSMINDMENVVQVAVVTEGKIVESALQALAKAEAGDRINMLMFYLSDTRVVKALREAEARGVSVRMVLDPNKDAFGRQKDGVPNRPVAHSLLDTGDGETAPEIRWCDTHGEQCHSKLLLIEYGSGQSYMTLGSANLTRRNIGDYNLEANAVVTGSASADVFRDARLLFDRVWANQDGRNYSTDYAAYKDDRTWKWWQYQLMEATGLSSF